MERNIQITAQALHESCILIALYPSEVEIAVCRHRLIPQFAQYAEQSHRVGTSAESDQYEAVSFSEELPLSDRRSDTVCQGNLHLVVNISGGKYRPGHPADGKNFLEMKRLFIRISRMLP